MLTVEESTKVSVMSHSPDYDALFSTARFLKSRGWVWHESGQWTPPAEYKTQQRYDERTAGQLQLMFEEEPDIDDTEKPYPGRLI